LPRIAALGIRADAGIVATKHVRDQCSRKHRGKIGL
jgi:hypothetical protein